MPEKITQQYLTLTPAYGRDFKSAREAQQSFMSGQDWQIATVFGGNAGRYCSVRDFADGVSVELRYAKQTKSTVIKV